MPTTTELLALAYDFIGIDNTRVPAPQMQGWAVRAVNDLFLQADKINSLWYLLSPLEQIENFLIGSDDAGSNNVLIDADFLKIRPQGDIVGRPVTFYYSTSDSGGAQGRVNEATLSQPQVKIISDNGKKVLAEVFPHQFNNFKLTVKALAVPDFANVSLRFSPVLTELIISRIAMIAAEEFPDAALLQLATAKWNDSLSRLAA